MNLYFLVEGKLEAKLYPKWLSYLLPKLKRVKQFHAVQAHSYYLFNAGGYPHILDEDLPNAIREVNECGQYDYLILCFDADEDTVDARRQAVHEAMAEKEVTLQGVSLEIIVQNRCIETWFLGNRTFYKRNPENPDLRAYTRFYNVAADDPELMPSHGDFFEVQQFHKTYFKLLCQERRTNYSEKLPGPVQEEKYLDELQKRLDETSHLNSFRYFYQLCQRIKPSLK